MAAALRGPFATVGSLLCAAVLLASARDQQAAAPPTPGTSSLAGVVIDHELKTPLASVSVELRRSGSGNFTRQVTTDPAGRFLFSNVQAGSYELTASAPGWLPAKYGQKKPDRSGTAVVVNAGQALAGLSIGLYHGAVITGRVTGLNNQPLVRVEVHVLRLGYSENGRFLDPIQVTTTDDRGQYRVFGLSPSSYVVRAWPNRGYSRETSSRDALDDLYPRRSSGYALSYFPGVKTPGQAAPLSLAIGEERQGVDFSLAPEALVSVQGQLVGAGAPLTEIQFARLDDDGLLREGEGFAYAAGADGQFVIPNVRAGSLDLVVRALAKGPDGKALTSDGSLVWLWGRTRVSVGDRELTNVTVAMQPGATVSGEIKLERSGNAPWPPDAQLALEAAGASNLALGRQLSRIGSDGRFVLHGMPPGQYHVAPYIASPWSIASVTRDGLDITGSTIDVSAADISGLVVTFVDRRSSLAGTLRGPSGTNLADFTVIAFPVDRSRWSPHPRAVYAARPNTEMRFAMSNVLPGEYFVALADDLEPNSWFDPQVLEQLSRGAVRLTIAPGESKIQDLMVR